MNVKTTTGSKPVAPRLAALAVGDQETYPAKQLDSVLSAFYRLRKKQGVNFSYSTNKDTNEITVTRTV